MRRHILYINLHITLQAHYDSELMNNTCTTVSVLTSRLHRPNIKTIEHINYILIIKHIVTKYYVIKILVKIGLERVNEIHRESKKQDTKLLPITLPNIGRFSKFFHC